MLSDANQLHASLSRRLTALNEERVQKLQRPPDEAAQELVRSKRVRREAFEKESDRLVEALDSFIVDYLGPMVAAEELGGPVAGETDDIGADVLITGFSSQGKPKKSSAKVSQAGRQQRLDEIWGQRDENATSESTAAAFELQALVETLLENPSSYLDLPRDTAAARFLVRAKVAQFHPKDARKLRLLDFGRENDP